MNNVKPGNHVVEGMSGKVNKERLMLRWLSPLEVSERFSVIDCPSAHQVADSRHDNGVFVRINALANVIFDFQRPVVAQKHRRKVVLGNLQFFLVRSGCEACQGSPESELV